MKNADRIGEAGRPCSCPCSPASSARPPSGCRRLWLGCAEAGDWMTRPALHRGAQVGLAGAPGRAVARGEEPGGRALLQAARRASGHQGVWAACRASIQHPAGHPGHTQSRRPAAVGAPGGCGCSTTPVFLRSALALRMCGFRRSERRPCPSRRRGPSLPPSSLPAVARSPSPAGVPSSARSGRSRASFVSWPITEASV